MNAPLDVMPAEAGTHAHFSSSPDTRLGPGLRRDDADMIPVIVLTGFLGSGKTTLLGRLLRHPQFARTAVIINEFGEIGLDHDLVETSEESFVTLQTGCLCCAVRGDLVLTLEDILRRRDAGEVTPFERVVIETSGLADPAPILHALMTDSGLAQRLAIAGVVATVDAVNGLATLARQPESLKQVAVADRLLLTKTDLVGSGEAEALAGRLSALNPGATVLTASFGDVAPERLFALEGDYGEQRCPWKACNTNMTTTATKPGSPASRSCARCRSGP